MKQAHLVSIIIPAYNRAGKIGRPLESILAQTYKNWEIIIVDDASNDNTEEIVKKYHIENLVYIKNLKNSGPAFSRNVGIKHAKGEYIAFLDSDDHWYPYHLEESVKVLEDTGFNICSAFWNEIKDGIVTYVGDMEWFKERLLDLQRELDISIDQKIWKLNHNFYEFTLKTDFYCFQINTIVLKREILYDTGLFHESLEVSEDLEFLYRIFAKYSLVIINRPHFAYYFGDDNLWAFVDRENNFGDFPPQIQERLFRYLGQKIKFYQKLDEMLTDSDIIHKFKNPDDIFNTIYFCIVRRCLTLMLLNEKNTDQYPYYNSLAYKYARNEQLQFLYHNYKQEDVIPQYFYLY